MGKGRSKIGSPKGVRKKSKGNYLKELKESAKRGYERGKEAEEKTEVR